MLKKLSLLFLSILLAFSCASKPYDYISGTPKLRFTGTYRMSRVGKPFPLKLTILGRMPSPDQPVTILIKIWGDERTSTILNLPYRTFTYTIAFTELDYYESTGKLRGNEFGDTWLDRYDRETDLNLDQDQGNVRVDVEVWLIEPDPTDPNKWIRTHRWVQGHWAVRLTCPHCIY